MNNEYEPTAAEIEAGAQALASAFFLDRKQWPLDRFGPSQQQDFRNKARAVLQAAAKVRGTHENEPVATWNGGHKL